MNADGTLVPGDPLIHPGHRRFTLPAVTLLCGLGAVLAYLPAIDGPFLFDDLGEIPDNPAIRTLWPPWRPMFEGGELPHRPIPYYTFALNHALGQGLARAIGTDPFWPLPFHAVNLAIHLANGWLLFRCLRQTLSRPPFNAAAAPAAGWPVVPAGVAAAIWLVHPLHTEAVSYVYQRIELLAAGFALGTLAAFLDSRAARRPLRWLAASVACCGLGMACKEWVIVVPPVMLLFDRAFVGASWREVFVARGRYHAALFATSAILAAVVGMQWGRYPEAGFTLAKSVVYAVNQPLIVLWYLSRLALPVDLSLDHGQILRDDLLGRDAWLVVPLGAVIAMVLAAVVAFPRRPAAAFVVLAFLLLLAPTSSVLPVHDVCVEHRMYLASALPLAAAAVAAWRLLGPRLGTRGFVAAAAGCVMALAGITAARNTIYASPLAAWADAAAKSGGSSRSLARYGTELSKLDRHDDAVRACAEAVRRDRKSPVPHAALAAALVNAGRLEEAAEVARAGLATAARAGPDPVRDRLGMYLGLALDRAGDPAGLVLLREAARRRPDSLPAREHLARALLRESPQESAALWQSLVALAPADPYLRFNLANALARFDPPAAVAAYATAIRLDPGNPDAFNNLGGALVATGRLAEARAAFQRCLEIAPGHPQATANLRDPRLTVRGLQPVP
jgi:tetratricopeptide (TPR) repeat protein